MHLQPQQRRDSQPDMVDPRPLPDLSDCAFYTCMDLAPGESIELANWDYRGRFAQYIGNHPVVGKTVLDVGTASGFLAFSSEEAGAAKVTALDARDSSEFQRIPFAASTFIVDRASWIADDTRFLERLKNSFWYAWHKKKSRVEVVYANLSELSTWRRRFDVVIAGAIVEHVSDPVAFIGSLCSVAEESVIVAFTPVLETNELMMRAMNEWAKPALDYSWWELSIGLYRQIFANMGFRCSFVSASATCNQFNMVREITRPTIVAMRITG